MFTRLSLTVSPFYSRGWDQTGSNGANLSFPIEFGIGSESEKDTFLVGLVNAAPYIASALWYANVLFIKLTHFTKILLIVLE